MIVSTKCNMVKGCDPPLSCWISINLIPGLPQQERGHAHRVWRLRRHSGTVRHSTAQQRPERRERGPTPVVLDVHGVPVARLPEEELGDVQQLQAPAHEHRVRHMPVQLMLRKGHGTEKDGGGCEETKQKGGRKGGFQRRH